MQVVGVGGAGTLGGIRQVGASNQHTCAVTTCEQARCWGANASGQLGNATTTAWSSPVTVVGIGGTGQLGYVRWVDGGAAHTCVTTLADTALCWGRNDRDQVGDGTTTNSARPVATSGP